ncbi:MAG: DUF5723 family protein [Bacteroidales bacterium]|jgi:hypothetical protein|nr:DUF5723 family protein [Bacteroidales bacterium]
MKIKKIYILILISVVLGINAKAQQGMQFYTMNRVFQSGFMNVAAESPYTGHVGGLIVPIFGQLPPSMYLNVTNSGFHWNNLYHHGTGSQADSLVLDLNNFMKNLKKAKVNNTFINTHLELLNIGWLGRGDIFWSFNLTEKINVGFSLPYDLFELGIHGNYDYMMEGKPLDFSKLDVNALIYTELGIGASIPVNDKLRIGVRAKLLWGNANVETNIKKLTLNTATIEDDYRMTFDADMNVRSSLPILSSLNFYGTDSVKAEMNDFNGEFLKNNILKFKNLGGAIDLGFQYQIIDEVKVFASATDLGFIHWNNNTQKLSSKGEFTFRGLEIKPIDFDSIKYKNQWEALAKEFGDSVLNIFQPELQNDEEYTTFLPSNIYAGVEYKIFDQLQVGLLYRGQFYRKQYLQAGTLYINAPVCKIVSIHASYTVANHSYNNIGFGLTLRLGPVLWYSSFDNVLGMILPQKARMINVRMGCNLVFGYNDKAKNNIPRFKTY